MCIYYIYPSICWEVQRVLRLLFMSSGAINMNTWFSQLKKKNHSNTFFFFNSVLPQPLKACYCGGCSNTVFHLAIFLLSIIDIVTVFLFFKPSCVPIGRVVNSPLYSWFLLVNIWYCINICICVCICIYVYVYFYIFPNITSWNYTMLLVCILQGWVFGIGQPIGMIACQHDSLNTRNSDLNQASNWQC